jgi:hypothetical protein
MSTLRDQGIPSFIGTSQRKIVLHDRPVAMMRVVASAAWQAACRSADALARRRKRSQDQLPPALMPLLRDSEPGDGPDGFPPGLARTIALNVPRVPIGDLGFTEG